MARCEQGYLCDVCGLEVESIDESDLYLRYVIGEVDPESLHNQRERHIRCNPTLAQFIRADGFEPVRVTGYFDKAQLDPAFVADEEARVTRGYLRLQVLVDSGLSILEYPLPEIQEYWRKVKGQAENPGPKSNDPPDYCLKSERDSSTH